MSEEVHKLLHTLWSKAVGQPGYDKHEWSALEEILAKLDRRSRATIPSCPHDHGSGKST